MLLLVFIVTSLVCGVVTLCMWCKCEACTKDSKASEINQSIMEDCQTIMDIKMQTFIEEMMKIFLRIHDHAMACILQNPIHLEQPIHGMKISRHFPMNFKDIQVFDCNEEQVPFKIVNKATEDGLYFFDTNTEMIVEFFNPVVFKRIEFIELDLDNFTVYGGAKIQFFTSLSKKHGIGMVRVCKEKNIICNTAITYSLIQ